MGDLLGSPRVAPLLFPPSPLLLLSFLFFFFFSVPGGEVGIGGEGALFQAETGHRARLVATRRARPFSGRIPLFGASKGPVSPAPAGRG